MVPHTVKLLSPTVIRDVCSKTVGSWEGVSTALKGGVNGMFATGMSRDGDSRGVHYPAQGHSAKAHNHYYLLNAAKLVPSKSLMPSNQTKASRNGPPHPTPTWTCCNSRLLAGSLQVKMSKWTRVKKAERRLMVEVCDALKSL